MKAFPEVALTGSEGFIGRWILQRLTSDGFNVRVLERPVEDLHKPDSLIRFVSEADVIIHLAGKNRGTKEEIYSSNVVGTLGLLNSIEAYGKERVLLLFASSLQVYAPTSSISNLNEAATKNVSQPFSNSKLLAESLIKKWAQKGTLRGISLRIANVYGPGCRPYYNSVVSTFIEECRKDGTLVISGDGSQSRDFIYISDVAEAFSVIAKDTAHSGFEAFNLCTGESTSILSLARTLVERYPKSRISVSNSDAASETHLVGDGTRLEAAFGVKPRVTLQEGLTRLLADS